MNIIILSGGSGKRLWPLSNETRSKQFLQLLKSDDGEYESMLQRIYRQIRQTDSRANIIVATAQSQVDSIRNQLGKEVELVIEPERRNTFPAIALSAAYLAYKKGISSEEPVLVLPVDPFVEVSYFKLLEKMEEAVRAEAAEILLMGTRPTYPSGKYGYIQAGAEHVMNISGTPVYEVVRYAEKPREEDAAGLIAKGAYWNAGVFALKLGYALKLAEDMVSFSSYEELLADYPKLKKNSFDYEVLENAESVAMIPYQDAWKDLGTWNTLTEEMDSGSIGEAVMDVTCSNTHVINELSIPMVVLGAKDMIIAASPDGILVSDKHQSSYLKPYVDGISERPMFEERRWGDYKVLDYVTYEDGTKSLTKHLHMNPGESISYQAHNVRDEIWTISDGEGYLVVDDIVTKVGRGHVAYIKKGQKHAMKAITGLHFIEVQLGTDLVEEDILRFDWSWEDR